jgi:hypothetical protein
VEDAARSSGKAVLLLDEIQHLDDWSSRLKPEWDRLKRERIPVQVVASGSSALRLGHGSRETLAGRFERLELVHWSAASIASLLRMDPLGAAELSVRLGTYPGALPFRDDTSRWAAYLRDAVVAPAIDRDIVALEAVRRPALLKQVFAVAVSSPAQIVSLQKIQGRLQDSGSLHTLSHYLGLLEEAYLVAALEKHAASSIRGRAAPPKLVPLNNAFLAASDPSTIPERDRDPARFGAWVENACLAHGWNSGSRVAYWREGPLEVDGVLNGPWGKWAIEVKTGDVYAADLRPLREFVKRFKGYEPLVLCEPDRIAAVRRAMVKALDWRQFLVEGPGAAA